MAAISISRVILSGGICNSIARLRNAKGAVVCGDTTGVQAIASAVWAHSGVRSLNAVLDNNMTHDQALRMMAAVLLGKVSGAGTGTEVFTAAGGNQVRVTSTVDAAGNRVAVTLTPGF